jgi:aspartate/methionine/tyrosine aminotransferase
MKIKTANRLQQVGEYYFSRKLKEIAKMRNKGIDVINLGIGSPDQAPASETIQTLVTESRKADNHAYQSYAGIPELRKAFASWYQKYFNVDLNPDNEILPLMGSKEGIMHLSMAFVNPGEKVLIPNPGYPAYAAVVRLLGAEAITYQLEESKQWMPDFDALEKLDLTNVKMMWVNYPHMPTGTPATTRLFERLVDFGLKHNILIVNDNPYSFVLNDEQLSILQVDGGKEIALELNSMSKSHNMAGWRIGMLAGKAEYVQAVLQAKSNMDSGMFRPLQLAAVKALGLGKSWYEQLNDTYSKRRKLAFAILDQLKCSYNRNQVGMFVWARIPDEFNDGESLSEKILKESAVFITPGFIFGSVGQKYVRISLCATENRLHEALSRLK